MFVTKFFGKYHRRLQVYKLVILNTVWKRTCAWFSWLIFKVDYCPYCNEIVKFNILTHRAPQHSRFLYFIEYKCNLCNKHNLSHNGGYIMNPLKPM